MILLVIAVFLFVGALILLLRSGSQSKASVSVSYSDMGSEQIQSQPLYSDRYQLVGKPDYVLETEQGLVPVEVKKHSRPPSGVPYPSERFQLAANCLLVEEHYGTTVTHGEIHYGDGHKTRIPFDTQLRQELLRTLAEMQAAASKEQNRSHSHAKRCQKCSYTGRCGQELTK